VDPEASSTGEMITLLAQAMKLRISPAAATCLYTAILTDTGSFQFSNTTPRALRAAADLIEAGASAAAVADYYYHSKPASHLLLLAQALSTLDFNPDFSRGEAELNLDMFKKAGAGSDASEGIINWINDVETVKVSILYRQVGDRRWKVSLRSKGELNVAELTARFGGGGHQNAAGCTVEGDLPDVKRIIREQVDRLLAINSAAATPGRAPAE
jgi:phosphoesterase RecJ-like protein